MELTPSLEQTVNVPNLIRKQALALQLAYDNIQIVLHRQSMFGLQLGDSSNTSATASTEQLVESALRTAQAPSNGAIIPMCQSSHAAMHAAICLFTTGVVLSALYLSRNVSSRFDELLPALERIILFFENFPGQHYHLTPQCLEILHKLRLKCSGPSPEKHSRSESVAGTTMNGEMISDELRLTR